MIKGRVDFNHTGWQNVVWNYQSVRGSDLLPVQEVVQKVVMIDNSLISDFHHSFRSVQFSGGASFSVSHIPYTWVLYAFHSTMIIW